MSNKTKDILNDKLIKALYMSVLMEGSANNLLKGLETSDETILHGIEFFNKETKNKLFYIEVNQSQKLTSLKFLGHYFSEKELSKIKPQVIDKLKLNLEKCLNKQPIEIYDLNTLDELQLSRPVSTGNEYIGIFNRVYIVYRMNLFKIREGVDYGVFSAVRH